MEGTGHTIGRESEAKSRGGILYAQFLCDYFSYISLEIIQFAIIIGKAVDLIVALQSTSKSHDCSGKEKVGRNLQSDSA